jgi:NAD(P)-dependent dehydrogenase (short-subunit alcohol dehydrogenase family)
MKELAESVAIFGASGAIGQALVQHFLERGWEVYAVSRNDKLPAEVSESKLHWVSWDIPVEGGKANTVGLPKPMSAIVWAQGANCNDDIYSFDRKVHDDMYAANVTYILVSLHALLQRGLLVSSARLCIISSIWQNIARQRKLSYTISKSALQGLVQSLAIDLGKTGVLVNAVLPGALDTPMTRANLTAEQVRRLEEMSPLGSLPSLSDVCNLVSFLCSQDNTGITGQFITADRGFSNARII